MKYRTVYVFFLMLVLSMNHLACGHSDDLSDNEDTEISTSETGDMHQEFVQMSVNIEFPEYVSGDFWMTLRKKDGQSVPLQEPKRQGWISETTVCQIPSDIGAVTLTVFNDVNQDAIWQEEKEPLVVSSGNVAQKDVEFDIRLSWIWENTDLYPKQAIINYNPSLSADNDLLWTHFATADLLILDHSLAENCPDCLKILRNKNPRIALFLYVDPLHIAANEAIRSRSILERSKFELIEATTRSLPDYGQALAYMPGLWNGVYVRKLQYWTGAYLINFTSEVLQLNSGFFESNARIYAKYFRDHAEQFLAHGYLLDNVFDDISWVSRNCINGVCSLDYNYNGVSDDLEPDTDGYFVIDRKLQEGIRNFLESFQKENAAFIIGNEGNPLYLDLLHGKFFENAPYGAAWAEKAWLFEKALKEGQGNFSIWHMVVNENQETEAGKRCLTGIITASLFGGYYACGNEGNNVDYGLTVPRLGRKTPGYENIDNGVLMSIFEHGIVLFNPNSGANNVPLHRPYMDIHGREIFGKVEIPAYNGVILYY